MPFALREGADTDGLPVITLAGEPYFVARLPLGNRIKVQLALPKVAAYQARLAPLIEDIKAGKVTQFELAEDEYLALVDIISNGLLPLYPTATRQAVLAQPIDFDELFAAWPVVVKQGASRSHAAGEALATSNTPENSGTGSSPTSV
jgi:hypothetical protein